MESMNDTKHDVIHYKSQQEKYIKEDEPPPPPPDKFFFVRITVLLLALSSLLTSTFITSAYDYWMYKFRDPAMGEVYDATNKTTLQVNFASGLSVAMAVPALIGLAFGVTFAQRFKSRNRIYICYGIIILGYILTTTFVKIDTDAWQATFFAVTMVLLGLKSMVFTTLLSTLIVKIPKLPPIYMKWYMYGQGSSGIFSVILQIICLAIVDDSVSTALIYFSSGTALFIVTLIMYYFTQYSPLFIKYVNKAEKTTAMTFPKWNQLKSGISDIWEILAIQALVILGNLIAHTTITNLIVSDSYGDGSEWTQKFFVPVITIFYGDVVGVLGRISSTAAMTRKNAKWFVLVNILRVIVFPILFIYCNVSTPNRKMKPLFPHDWQYMIILAVFVFTQGYFSTVPVLSMPNFITEGVPIDLYYLLLTVILTTCGFLFSPLGVVIVNML